MKTIIYFTLGLLFLKLSLYAQQMSFSPYTTKFILFKTADDFFENKNGIVYPVKEIAGKKLKCIDTLTGKKYNINLLDSNYFGFNMAGYGPTSLRYVKANKVYYPFGGGTKKFCFIFTYDMTIGGYTNGYISSFIAYDIWGLNVYYIKDGDESTAYADFDVVAKDKQDLANQYKKEQKETDKNTWQRNLINTAIKYTKKYNELK